MFIPTTPASREESISIATSDNNNKSPAIESKADSDEPNDQNVFSAADKVNKEEDVGSPRIDIPRQTVAVASS